MIRTVTRIAATAIGLTLVSMLFVASFIGATLSAVRDVVSFNDHALAGPLLTLCLWAGISAVALAAPVSRLARRRPRPATALTPVSSAA